MFTIEKFLENGFAIIEHFLTDSEVSELKGEVTQILQDIDTSNKQKAIFSVNSRDELYKTDYFLNSNARVSLFYEELNDQAVNKIGHALHVLNPAFKRVTFSDKIKDVARQLGLEEAVVVQSMYIFKNSKIGGKVRPHQDATYLNTTPCISGLGLWMAIEDADETNGCLQVLVASHKSGLHNGYQLVRKMNVAEEGMGGGSGLGYKGKEPSYCNEAFVPLVVKKGSLVLLDPLLVHYSDTNNSQTSRNAFTLHLYDASKALWNPLNWLQPSNKGNFVNLYTSQPVY